MEERHSRSNGRETKAHILKFAQAELEKNGPVKFNILRVIEESGVSRSSIYHHFRDRDGLITSVEVERLIAELKFSNEILRLGLNASTSGETVFKLLDEALMAASSPLGRQQRAHRIAVIAAAQNIPELHEAFVEHSRASDAYLAETLEMAASQGLVELSRPAIDIARFLTTLFLGRISVDGFDSVEIDESWVKTTVGVLRFLLPPVS